MDRNFVVKALDQLNFDFRTALVKDSFFIWLLENEIMLSLVGAPLQAKRKAVMMRTTGRFETAVAGGDHVQAFVPVPLPPREPSLVLDGPLRERLRAAERALTRLNLTGEMAPSLGWFLYTFVRKEAVVSSQMEGTQATLMDLFTFEAEGKATPDPNVAEVCNYLEALSYTRDEVSKPGGLPLSMRLLNEAHRRLMRGVRGARHLSGEARRSQNWIGGSRPANAVHVPPPVPLLPELLADFEKYLHADDDLPALVRVGLAHVQFETIHPYLDGNGRIGRLLIALLLQQWGLLKVPLLYLSLFFKRHSTEYFRRLNAVRSDGDWEGWTDFFLDGVATIAEEATASAQNLFAVVSDDRARVLAQPTSSVAAARLFELLPDHPIITVAGAQHLIGITRPTATRAIETLVATEILVEITGRTRSRRFAYNRYLAPLLADTEITPTRLPSSSFIRESRKSSALAIPAITQQNVRTTSINARTATVATADCSEFIDDLEAESIDLILTSPPYFIGKEYDDSTDVSDFERTIGTLVPSINRVLRPSGSLCFQVGNHVRHNQVMPLDYAVARAMDPHASFVLRNRIIWTFSHGSHLRRRFSGRHETMLWYTKGDEYFFDLDAARIPQKYPGKKHYKGPNKGKFSGNPLGKNPGDFWDFGATWDIPNVKANHVEKTCHPCQFPVALARRIVVALSPEDGIVFDPFLGSGTTAIASLLEGRHFVGCDISAKYTSLANTRLRELANGSLRYRPDVPVQFQGPNHAVALTPPHFKFRRPEP